MLTYFHHLQSWLSWGLLINYLPTNKLGMCSIWRQLHYCHPFWLLWYCIDMFPLLIRWKSDWGEVLCTIFWKSRFDSFSKASITCLNKFKPEDEPSKKTVLYKIGREMQSPRMGRQPYILTSNFLGPVKCWIVTLWLSFEPAESDWGD